MRLLKILFLIAILLPSMAGAQIFVATNGSDKADGTKEQPLASVAMALRKVRDLRRLNDAAIKAGVHIMVGQGIYQFTEPLFIRPEDAGTESSPTIIEAKPGEEVVFSGGVKVVGWRKAGIIHGLPKKAQGNVWETDAPMFGGAVLNFRQMWVNARKAILARDKNADSMYRILSWDKKTEQCWIPKPATAIPKTAGMELVIHQWWAIAILRVKSAMPKGDSVLLSFHQPESRIQSEHPWPAPWISSETGNSAFYLSNAIQFLDEPGEWYLDKSNRKLYYWPRNSENLKNATVVVPAMETLVKVQGTMDRPVSYIRFRNISFQHTTWLRPSEQGHVPLQAGMYLLDAYKLKVPGTPDKKTLENQAWVGRPAATVAISYSNNIDFERCRFQHLASTALDYGKGVQSSEARGNLFKDIGGTAILAGVFSDAAVEAHLPYTPSDKREVCDHVTITNNLITDVANEDWGCVGIGAGFVKNAAIEHNDISDVPYTGISLGWGWTKSANVMQNNKVTANRIHRYARQLYDVAAIYTLSAQPGTVISENDVDSIYKAPYAHLPAHWFYLYTDEGTSGVTVKNNWTPSEKYLQNANGPGNLWENNGPMVADSIRRNAGLQQAYKGLLYERQGYDKKYHINRELPVIIELTTAPAQALDIKKLNDILAANKVHTRSLYQWQSHYVIFDRVQDVSVLKGKLQQAFPALQVKVYYDAFYEFNRQYCSDTTTAKEWDHVILTANLVNNPKLQKEYLDYHATQFEKWPEVSRGFCNAGFQRLLVYRNGRQLMLVISIPKGESLDQLNPKTTQNNPRVNEWNRIMGKYQEGIEGTKPGEVWVFLQPVESNK